MEGIIGDGSSQMLLKIIIINDLGNSLGILVVGAGTFSVHEFWVLPDPIRDITIFGHHTLCLIRLLSNGLRLSPFAHEFQIG